MKTANAELEDGEHPWKETRNFHPDDGWLRDNGFTIAERPNKGPVLWKKGGKKYTQLEALAACSGLGG